MFVDFAAESPSGQYLVRVRDSNWKQNGNLVMLSKEYVFGMEIVENSPTSAFDPDYVEKPLPGDQPLPGVQEQVIMKVDFTRGDRTAYLELDTPIKKKEGANDPKA